MKKTKLLLALCLANCLGYAQVIYTVAGTGTGGSTGDGGFATSATINTTVHPNDLSTLIAGLYKDASGNLYLTDGANYKVRKVSSTGIISTIAGTGTSGYTGDGGAATSAKLNWPAAVAVDGSGNIYIADMWNHVIRKINGSGIISTFAGTGTAGFSGDNGAATSAKLNYPLGLAFDGSGNLYITDWGNVRIRKVDGSGVITTVAGNGTNGFSGDGGAATSAKLYHPAGITFDGSGNLYIADISNERIRKVNTSGTISTYAGNGTAGYSGDGSAATSAKLNEPSAVAFDASGNLYIADANNYVIRKVNSSGTISTYAGTGTAGFSGDGGAPASANLNYSLGLGIDGSANLYIVDGVYRIREISANCPANGGPNKTDANTNCCGCTTTGAQIGSPSVASMTYSWGPNTNLSSTTVAQPTSTWCSVNVAKNYTVTVSGTGCTTATSTVNVTTSAYVGTSCCRIANSNSTTGEPLMEFTNFTVFPNPTNNQITVALYNTAEYIRVVDLTGKVAFEIKNVTDAEFKVDVSKFAKGAYFVIAKIGDKLEKQKLIVE